MNLRYDAITASKCKECRHPQIVMVELGITYSGASPHPIGDCWHFFDCENIPEKLPDFLAEF